MLFEVKESWFSLGFFSTELPNIIIYKDDFIFLGVSSFYFSPFSSLKVKCLELLFYFICCNKTRTSQHLQGWGRQLGCKAPHQTDSRTGKNLSFCFEAGCSHGLPTATSWGPGQEREAHPMWLILIPCPAAGPWTTLASLGLLTETSNSSGTRGIPWESIPPVPRVRPPLPLAWQWQKSPTFCLLWHVEWWQRLKNK